MSSVRDRVEAVVVTDETGFVGRGRCLSMEFGSVQPVGRAGATISADSVE
jgi:hypothetical protein